jgi:cell division protein FtsI/penicillin-binding protein 2
MKNSFKPVRVLLVLALVSVVSVCASAASISARSARLHSKSSHRATIRSTETAHASKRPSQSQHRARLVRASVRTSAHRRFNEHFATSSFAEDQTFGDVAAGEDPIVRRAAIDALGNMNGTVVAIDPASGRILAMVNQKLALSAGAIPCSTIKVPVALAALSENLITKDTTVMLSKYSGMTLTQALAHSNNAYFETVGRRLGFEKYSYYAHQFGLGELAGWDIAGEHLGTFPNTPLQEKLGGVGKMCSFGESISMTPLQLGALLSAMANGGTLYYLQHPASPEEVVSFQPRVKRHLDIGPLVPQIADGMAGAVQYGTARSLRLSFSDEPVLGKTGTCSNDAGTRYGWFGSFANTEFGRIVVVVFLEGGRPTFGPKAAELAGHFYRNLEDHNFFASQPSLQPASTAGMDSSFR